ncbi:MAG: peptidyl-prolyl cis-trans isomerase [Pyrinomonadaceae bacterium]
MRKIYIAFFLLLAACSTIFSQETQTRVVDEVVAQVNSDVITLSRVKRESKSMVDAFVQEGKKREEAQKLVDEKQGELIAGLINEELLIQRAKENGLDNDIEASVNQRFTEIMKQYKMKTVEELNAAMEKSGVDPKEMRETWRKQITREQVIQRELQSKVYWGFSDKELRDYYEKNKAKFTQPETISFSELFLGFAGRDEAAVREKANLLHKQLKAGGDFAQIVKDNGDTGVISQGAGKLEKLRLTELSDKIAIPLKDVKAGQYTAPFELEQLGMGILRVDAREQASSQSVFDEKAVRLAMLNERLPEEQKKYYAKLREDAYIKVSDAYRPLVAPILFADDRKAN